MINWGNGIVVVILSYMGFMAYMVTKSVEQDYFLVSQDYYKKEIAYQGEIEKIRNADGQERPSFRLDKAKGQATLTFKQRNAKGKVHFYRPSNARLDFSKDIKLNGQNEQSFDLAKVAGGLWEVKIEWESDGKGYYMQETVVL